jgi:hypothetical protein
VAVEVLLDDTHHQRLPDNDAEIIDRAVHVGELTGRNVTVFAGDYGMLYRAAAESLGITLMPRRARDAAPDSPELADSPLPADLPGTYGDLGSAARQRRRLRPLCHIQSLEARG